MHLKVTNFSCIESAELPLNPVTLIIGPQASGKSVLCKLQYFFLSIVKDQRRSIAELQSYETFKERVRKKFLRWFPVGSWGPKKFELRLQAGDFEVKLSRTEYRGRLGEAFRIHLSEPFANLYEKAIEHASSQKRSRGSLDFESSPWDVWEKVDELSNGLLGDDYFDAQLFIPAGRSFFTSVGRAIAAFEQSGTLDPLTLSFGRIYASRNEFLSHQPRRSSSLSKAIAEMLGGEIVRQADEEYLRMKDGRKIPFAALSSGQQELLPLLTMIPELITGNYKQILYIEEPEAHLFPSAQSRLIEILVGIVNSMKGKTSLVLTTHSPYVLAKFNNLMKAGSLEKPLARSKAAELLTQDCWLAPHQLAAYAIRNGVLISIMDDSGLINGDYLDDVSSDIAKEFDGLLMAEAGGQ